jgi:TolA-binding protein
MLKRTASLLVIAILCVTVPGCKKKEKDNLAERQAAFKEQQRRKAITSYQELVKKYPDSPYAAQAQERLQKLGPAPATPAKKKK